jgi:adenosine deaminase
MTFPKADRHCHSILAASLQSIIRWAGAPIAPAPSRMEGLPAMSAYARWLRLKAHVGEFSDAGLVERTWRVLDIDEIQHGAAAAASVKLMNDLRQAGIRMNVCPGSNVALLVTQDLGSHPIRTLVRHGLKVTVNSDDKTVFGRTVSEEFLELYRAGTLEAEELEELRIESLRA